MREPVVISRGAARYPGQAPFGPGVAYPELPEAAPGGEPNAVFAAVRDCLRLAGLDAARFGSPAWNPLARWIRPGQTVLLKPNWVKLRHPRDPAGWRYMVTHGSVVRAVAEYVAKALEGRGRIRVGDGPQTDSSFTEIADAVGATAVVAHLAARGLDVALVDFRREEWDERGGVIVGRRKLPGDPAGYVAYDLGADSRFSGHRGAGRYYGAFYDEGELNRHHSGGRHEYLLTGSAVKADVFVNLPKLKTHKKTGVTLNLKNLVGINGDKNWLPHHTEGHPGNGGDQFPGESMLRALERTAGKRLRRLAVALPGLGPKLLSAARRAGTRVAGDTETVVRSGNWHGNDTTWRMAHDLNAALLYGNPDGTLRRDGRAKPYLSFVDGVLAGEGSGPLNPDRLDAGLVAFGSAPADVDAACAWLMGFDPELLPIVREAYRVHPFRLGDGSWRDVRVVSNHAAWSGPLVDVPARAGFQFRPHFGWVGAVERARE